MSKRTLSALLLACSVSLFVAGCKKKVPGPPPPPPPERKVDVRPPAAVKPEINSFTAEPSTIEKGQSSTLRWSVSGANDISIDQGLGPVAAQGSRQVFPSTTTTYTLVANGPGGSAQATATVSVSSPPPPPDTPKAPVMTPTDILASQVQDCYFDYDKSDIRSDASATLTKDADVLKKLFADYPSFTVVVEGHCDERGSAEYNLALGDRRSTSAKDFLVQLGVPADRMKTISYGKERPQCTDATEDCYQRNRRAHFAPAQ